MSGAGRAILGRWAAGVAGRSAAAPARRRHLPLLCGVQEQQGPQRRRIHSSCRSCTSAQALPPLLADLEGRGLVHQTTDLGGLAALLGEAGGATVYCGFDLTAPSIHAGNLVMVMALVRCFLHGHRPLAILGGGTTRLGDPAGRDTERDALSAEVLEDNLRGIQQTLDRILGHAARRAGRGAGGLHIPIVNNMEWYGSTNAVEFIGTVGRHFRVQNMLARESVKRRMQQTADGSEGISYAEFSYQIFQVGVDRGGQ